MEAEAKLSLEHAAREARQLAPFQSLIADLLHVDGGHTISNVDTRPAHGCRFKLARHIFGYHHF